MTSLLNFGEGYVFAHRYQIGPVLGKGGMGTVYEAIHVPTARRRALKVMSYQLSGAPMLQQRFTREAQLGARIGSPFIVDVLDAGVDEATALPYLAMERLEGEDLARLSRRVGPLPAATVARYVYEAALALRSCQAAGVVHRDVKPSNLFLSTRPDGERRIKLLDLGIAKLLAEGEATVTASIGTPAYMAPEQLHNGGRVTPATDSYALAFVAYTLLVGRAYFEDDDAPENVFALAELIRGGAREAASARARRAGVALPAELDEVFARATAATPGERYGSAVELVEALASALRVPLPAEQAGGLPPPPEIVPLHPPEATTQRVTALPESAPARGSAARPPRPWQVRAPLRWVVPIALVVGSVLALIAVTATRRSGSRPPPAVSARAAAMTIPAPPSRSAVGGGPGPAPAAPAPPAGAAAPPALAAGRAAAAPPAATRRRRSRSARSGAGSARLESPPPPPPLYSRD